MSGIVFLGTRDLDAVRRFYVDEVGCTIWLEQADCIVLKHGNMLLGFCSRDTLEMGGIIAFFLDDRCGVDAMHDRMGERAMTPPKENAKYEIYHFFAADPEDRPIEFQCFLHPVAPHLPGDDLLRTRRSVREYEDRPVPEDVIVQVFELCRWAPTSMNMQPHYYMIIDDRQTMSALASVRGSSSAPIAAGPLAVAICSDPSVSKRHIEDGDIGAYHFLLAAWAHGLGTCWIADMDREEVKSRLNIPQDHYVATVTPLGYPSTVPPPPARKDVAEFLRFPDDQNL